MSGVNWTTLSEVQARPVQWLWSGRIPFGKMTLLDGEPGSGKSLLALDIAARVTRGLPMPLEDAATVGPSNVVIYNDDDNLADTIRPRLEAAGADLTRVRCVDGEMKASDVADVRPALIVLDPLSAYLCQDGELGARLGLKNIARLAKESGAALLAVQIHPKGDSNMSEAYGAARTVLHNSTIGHGRRRVAVTKSNLEAVVETPPLVYQIAVSDSAVKIAGWADSV